MTGYSRIPYSPEQAQAMRETFSLLQKWGVRAAELARRAGVSTRTFDNFMTSNRVPAYNTWCRYYKDACDRLAEATNPELITLLKSATAQQGNTALSSLAEVVPEIQPADLRSVTDNFIGNYLAYNRSYVVGAYVNVAWARIFYDLQNHAPCFEYIYRSYRHVLRQLSGYIIPTSRTLNFIGSIDNTRNISMAILRRPAPPEDKFDLLYGILLSVTTEVFPYAAKVIMERLPPGTTIKDYDPLIRMRSLSEKQLNGESEEEFKNRQEILNRLKSIEGSHGLIDNQTIDGRALTLFPIHVT